MTLNSEDTCLVVRSEQFCASDADITLVSCDRVEFLIHKTNLDTHTGGFPPPGIVTPPSGEAVALSEASTVLELLFQYIYPQRQPDLTKLEFSILDKLSEAAEKYSVFSAMEICKFHMQGAVLNHPLQVLNYAVRHGYQDIADKAAPETILIPLEDIGVGMLPSCLGAWVRYYGQWACLLDASRKEVEATPHPQPQAEPSCTIWPLAREQILRNLGTSPGSLCNLRAVFFNIQLPAEVHQSGSLNLTQMTSCCSPIIESWSASIQGQVLAIPKFSDFL